MVSLPRIALPEDVWAIIAPELEYDRGELAEAVIVDLNGDHTSDYLVQSSSRLCGTGGCSYMLIDGSRRAAIGSFSGTPLYLQATRSHGYPVIQTYSHLNADTGTWVTYVYDGASYRVTNRRALERDAVDSLFTALREIPIWTPRPNR